ncbi:hypothetical protein ACFBZI_12020 [Moraxella sp. ZJ142]|uniref:hypothetical protein n=1 Tax=Moraxella marmotae TaxID=3344520 RepID=UPI0035D4DD6C
MANRNLEISDIVQFELTRDDLAICIENAKNIMATIIDRKDLHDRDDLERFNNLLMGEVSEMMVLRWFHSNGKYAVSAVDKKSGQADLGHDLQLRHKDGHYIYCSIKSSLSALKDLQYIVNNFKLATKRSELKEINIQVYFWLVIQPTSNAINRTTVLSLRNSAIIGWFGSKDLNSFESYATENREVPTKPLKEARSMESLLPFLS